MIIGGNIISAWVVHFRVMDISNALANSVCEQCSRERCVCPPNQRKGLLLQQLSTTVPVPPLLWILSMVQVYPSSSIPARTTPGQTDLSSVLLTSQQQSGCQGCQNHTPGYLHSYRCSESLMFYFWHMTLHNELTFFLNFC